MPKTPSAVKMLSVVSAHLSPRRLISLTTFKFTSETPKNSLAIRLLNKLPLYLAAEPYQLWISAALFLSGVTTVIYPRSSGSLGKTLPLWEVYSWGACLIVGSFTTLYGLVMASRAQDPVTHKLNREWERLGQLVLGISTAIWAFVIFSFGTIGIASGLLTLFLSLVCFTRALILKAIELYTPLNRVHALRTLRDVDSKIKSLQEGKDNGSD